MSARDKTKLALDKCFAVGLIEFKKLTKDTEPYRFADWKRDNEHRLCLYYEFDASDPESDGYQKRVPLDELVDAIVNLHYHGEFTRRRFDAVCRVARSDGSCDFAVTGRCLELLKIAEYRDGEARFALSDKARARELLADD